MSYGIEILRSNGSVQFDSRTSERTGLAFDPIVVAPNASATVNLTGQVGRTVQVNNTAQTTSSIAAGDAPSVSVSYAAGFPTVSVSARPFEQVVFVLAE